VEEERCVMFGAGMGHWPGRGRLTSRGRFQVIEGIHAAVGEIILRVGCRAVGHTLIWRTGRLNLSTLAPGQAVVIAARRVGIVPRLWRGLFPGAIRPTRQEP
jgi:hypothetical protein